MGVAALFPGQGSFVPGCTRAWLDDDADGVLRTVSDAAGIDVVEAGDEEHVGRDTARAQPVIMAASLAAWHALRRGGLEADLVAGHSLGEYSAATAAGTLALDGAARVVATRGAATAAACAQRPGGMAAVIKLDAGTVEGLVARLDGVVIANDNAPGQIVVAGDPDALSVLRDEVQALGGRAVVLDVEGAFHSPAMAPAVESVRDALAAEPAADPTTPLVSGARVEILHGAAAVVASLVDGILSSVRWREVQLLLERSGITDLVEVGPGRVLAGIARRTVPSLRIHVADTPAAVREVLARLVPSVAPGPEPAT